MSALFDFRENRKRGPWHLCRNACSASSYLFSGYHNLVNDLCEYYPSVRLYSGRYSHLTLILLGPCCTQDIAPIRCFLPATWLWQATNHPERLSDTLCCPSHGVKSAIVSSLDLDMSAWPVTGDSLIKVQKLDPCEFHLLSEIRLGGKPVRMDIAYPILF